MHHIRFLRGLRPRPRSMGSLYTARRPSLAYF